MVTELGLALKSTLNLKFPPLEKGDLLKTLLYLKNPPSPLFSVKRQTAVIVS